MKRILAIGILTLVSAKDCIAADRFEPGSWRSTSYVGGRKAETKGPRCISALESRSMNGAAESISIALENDPAWKGCKIRDVKAEGMSVAFTAACAGDIVTTSQTRYAGSSYDGTMSVAMAGALVLAMTIKGERTGPCP